MTVEVPRVSTVPLKLNVSFVPCHISDRQRGHAIGICIDINVDKWRAAVIERDGCDRNAESGVDFQFSDVGAIDDIVEQHVAGVANRRELICASTTQVDLGYRAGQVDISCFGCQINIYCQIDLGVHIRDR
jgi:hypothetical protein